MQMKNCVPPLSGLFAPTTAETAPYVTRVVVYRPKKAKDFNGTAVVEWLNVSGGVDANPDWVQTHNELVRAAADGCDGGDERLYVYLVHGLRARHLTVPAAAKGSNPASVSACEASAK